MPELLPWHAMQPREAVASLGSLRTGLDAKAVRERQKMYGPNVLQVAKPTPAWSVLLRQFESPFVFILLVAVIASAYARDWFDAGLVVIIILVNGLLGFVQEFRANRALAALRSYLPQEARVRRAGEVTTIAASELVPGDIVLLAAGDRVTADGRLLHVEAFFVDESVLTGESRPVEKRIEPVAECAEIFDRASMVFGGTSVAAGRAEVLIVTTGTSTEFGRIAELATEPSDTSTPLQRKLKALARSLAHVAALLAAVLFVSGLWRGVAFPDMLAVAAAIAVAIVPEGLLVAMTVILTVGMRRLLARKVLVRTLAAAEALGDVDVLCVDKTGTMTTGEMAVTEVRAGVRPVTAFEDERSGRLLAALTALSDGDHVKSNVAGALTDRAITRFVAAQTRKMPELPVIASLPFHPSYRLSARVVADGHARRMVVLGALDALVSRLDAPDTEVAQCLRTHDEMTKRGLRVLAVADGTAPSGEMAPESVRDLTLLGLVGITDPLRPSVPGAVLAARQAGIRTIMITGDHPETAKAIALDAGIVEHPRSRVVTGVELSTMDDAVLTRSVVDASIFARVLPEQKLRIVNALKLHGHAVAMTGDGINDAPALQAADVGIAVGHATDVAKEIADLVLLESDFAHIVDAVREGRTIIDNLRKEIGFLLGFSLSEAVVIAGAIVLNLPLPLLPVHILFINLIADGVPSMALAFEPTEPEVMRRAPERHRRLLDWPLRRVVACASAVSSAALLGGLLWFNAEHVDASVLRTWTFALLGVSGIVVVFALRTLRTPFWRSGLLRNPYLLGAVVLSALLLAGGLFTSTGQAIFAVVDMPKEMWSVLAVLVVVQFIAVDAAKTLAFRRSKRSAVLSSN